MGEKLDTVRELLTHLEEGESVFTGQYTIEIHCKEGAVKDVYIGSRSKVDG